MSTQTLPPVAVGSRDRLFAGVVGAVLLLDQLTKWIVERTLVLHDPVSVIEPYLRLTYIHNPGAAFGLHVGPWSRWVFLALAVVAVVVLWRLYRSTPPEERVRRWAAALVSAGALGNLIDRLRSPLGVIDFLDVGLDERWRWPVFNVADMAVSIGAVLLAWSLWREPRTSPPDGHGSSSA
mgnify:CR=1 FL=1|jgi:signal peptidase II